MVSRIFARLSPAFLAKTPAKCYVRLETDFRSKETHQGAFRHELQSILVQDTMLMSNYLFSTPITVFPDGLFIYTELAAKLGMWDLSLRSIEDQHKISPETLGTY